MKKLKKILSVLALIVLVGSDFLTSISYALDDMLDDSVVVQIENEEAESVETEEEKIDEEDGEDAYEDESIEEELETENPTGDIVEEGTGEVSEIGSGEIEEISEENEEEITEEITAIDELKNMIEGEIKSEGELTGNNLELSNAWEILNEEVIEKSEKYNDVIVNVKALEGSFPKGTYAEIEAVKGEYLDEVKQQLSDESDKVTENSEMVAFDIKFLYKLTDGTIEELQPKKGELVQVTFDYSDNEELKSVDENENKELEVYHINDKDENGEKVEKGEEKIEKIEFNQKESEKVEDAVVIDAEKFSVYVLTLVENGTETGIVLTLDSNDGTFVGNENITVNEGIGTIVSTSGDVILPGAVKDGYNFAGWYSDAAFQNKLGGSGDSVNIPESMTGYARWTRTITYVYSDFMNFSGDECIKTNLRMFTGNNYSRDFEVDFDIDPTTVKSSESDQLTLLSEMQESGSYPGFVLRLNKKSNKTYYYVSNSIGGHNDPSLSVASTTNVNFKRQNKKLILNGTVVGTDTSSMLNINTEITVGCGLTSDNKTPRRKFIGDVSNIKISVVYDESEIIDLPEPEMINRAFYGWYSSPLYETLVDPNTITGNTTIYAKIDNGIMFNANGGSFTNGETKQFQIVKSGLTGTVPEEPTMNDMKFLGWYEEGSNVAFDFTGTSITGTVFLYAKWEQGIVFDANGGSFSNGETTLFQGIQSGGTGTLPEEPTMTGARFSGWYEEGSNVAFDFTGTSITGTVFLYAKWYIPKNSVVFNFGNEVKFNGSSYIDTDLRFFFGENLSRDFEINVNIDDISFLSNDQSNRDDIIQSTNESGRPWQGFNFRWASSGSTYTLEVSNGSGNKTSSIPLNVTKVNLSRIDNVFYYSGNKILSYSGVSAFNYPVFIGAGANEQGGPRRYMSGTLSDITIEIKYNSGETVTLPEPTRTDYTFGGWYTTPDFQLGTKIITSTLDNPGVTNLYAKWKSGDDYNYTVNYYKKKLNIENNTLEDGTEPLETGFVLEGGSGDVVNITGYLLTLTGTDGYEYSKAIVYGSDLPDGVETGSTTILGDETRVIDIYFVPVVNQFTLNSAYNTNTQGSSESTGYYYGAKVTLSGASSSDCFTWSGWNGLPEGTHNNAQTYFYMPANDVEVTPSVIEKSYNIIFSGNGNTNGEMSPMNGIKCTESTGLTLNTFGKSGYSFTGWSRNSGENIREYTDGQTVSGLLKTNGEDVVLYAVWDINNYEVTGSVAEGQGNMGYLSGNTSTGVSLTGLYEYGKNLVFIAIPELGYVFDYWKNGDTVLSGTDLGDGKNQLTVIVDQILDIIAFFKPAENTPYTVEHYKQNLDQTGYEFAWSGTMYGTTNGLTNATGTDYEGFTLSGDLVGYKTGVKADGSTVVRLYYNRNKYTVTRNMWEGHLNRRKIDKNVPYGTTPIFEWDDEDKYTPKRGREVDTDDIKYDFIFTGWIKSGSTEIIKDLTTQTVTGNVTYTAQYDTEYRYYEVRYHTDEGTGTMEPQSLQLYSSGTLNKNKFIRTGYIFSGWWYEYSDGIEVFYEDEQEINLGVEDGVLKSGGEWEDPLYLDVYAQWEPSTDTKFTVNCYTRELDKNYKVLSPDPKYLTGKQYTGKTDSGIRIGDYRAECLIDGYNIGHGFSGAILYGSDLPSSGVETGDGGNTTILADGTRRIDVYIAPKLDRFVINLSENCGYKGDPSGDYYYGSKIYLEANPFECYSFSGWIGSGLLDGFDRLSSTTTFFMPHVSVLTVTPTVKENTYNITFSGNGSTSGTMSNLSVLCTSGILSQNAFERKGYTFVGWSENPNGPVQFTNEGDVHRLSIESGGNVTLYAIWDINSYDVTGSVATGQENMGYLSGATSTGISLTGLYEYGTELIFIAVPELGYLFDYWEVNESTGLPEGVTASGNQLTVVVDQILDVVAHFKENVGTVTVNYYEMNTGGTYPGVANTATFTGLVGYTGYATVQPPVGFYLDTTSTVNTGIVISENNAENVINIYYARNKHNITLGYAVAFLNPGSVTVIPTPRESGYYYGEDVHFEAIVSTGYVFKQWRVNGVPVAGGADGVDFIMGDEDVELVVDGDLITYNIDYYTDPGSTDPMNPNPQTYTVLSGEIEIHNPIAEFCNDFLGWTGGTTGDWILTPTTGLVIDSSKGGDRKYYANWERKSYEVELSVDPSSGGTVTGEGTYRCMGEIELHATPNTGYHFVGWYDTGGNIVSSNSMYFFRGPVGSLGTGLTAKFERNQYYITIDKNGSGHFWGESAPSGRYYHGTPITFIASPSYGYKIQKWTKNRQNITTGANNELYTGYILDVTVTETGNYEVYFEPETYNIIYMDSGRVLTGLSPATYTVENHVYSGDLPSITKDGYTFAGWFYEYPWQPEYQIQEIGYVPVDGQSVTILAGWIPIDYNINYHLLTGVEIIPWEEYYPYEFYQSYNIETERTNLPEPQKSGYVFSGWIDQNHNYLTGFGGGMTGNLDLYPTWKSDVMGITVNYYEMDTNGEYPYDPYHEYPTQRHYYTGFTNSTFTVPDYSKTGFSFQYSIFRGNTGYNEPVTFEVSENDSENIINVYYQRSLESFQLYTNNGSKYNVSPDCWSDGYGNSCGFYYGTEITINNYIYEYDEGYSFSGWNIDSTSLPDDAYLSDGYITFSMPDHSVVIRLETNHILYKLTFTGYEGAEVMNYDSTYASLTGENYYRFDSEIELPYLNKPGYNFVGWNEGNSNVWSVEYTSYPYHPIWNMPSHDVELTAVFEPRTNMEYYKYYYFQDTEGTGYSLSGYDRYEDGITDQRVSSNCNYVEGFTHSRGEPDILYIKATGDNYINCYYDRDEYWVDVIYDNKELSIDGTGKYRYEAPVNIIATANTGYEFSGFSSEWPEYNTTGSTLSFNVPLLGPYSIYADANPIEYSIEYELDGGRYTPSWYENLTTYTIENPDIPLLNPEKDGYKFLGWTGGVVSGGIEGEDDIVVPTRDLVITGGSIGDRKYYANWEPDEVKVTVNYYLKKLNTGDNVLIDDVDIYREGVIFTGIADRMVNISGTYLTGIVGYHYDHATVFSGGERIGATETTVLPDGSREINMYYIPNKYNFTLNSDSYSSTEGSSESTGYYYGATVRLSGDSNNDCYSWSGWTINGITLSDSTSHQTWFAMPANDVDVTPSTTEKTYNIIFNGNGSTLGEMSSMNGVRCTESTGLTLNNFGKDGYTFTGWSITSGDNIREYTDGQVISGLSMNDGENVNLYAVWDIDWYTVTFDLNGGSLTGDMTETKDYTIETPEISLEDYIPVKTGYNFSGWYKDNDLANSIAGGKTGNYTLKASWEADSDTEFKVEYYLQNVEDDGYTFAETGLQTGTTNTTGYADITKEFTGFIFSGGNQNNITSGLIAGDGSLVLKLYYDRKEYNVTTGEVEHGTMEGETGNQRYGKVITFTAHPEIGYILDKWFKNGEEIEGETGSELTLTVEEGMEISGHFIASTGIEYRVEYYYQNAEDGSYPSSATSGEIRKGTTDTIAEVMTGDKNPTVSGYSFDSENEKNVLSGNINGSGDLVLKVYFKKQFTVKYLTGDKGLFDIEIYEGLDYSGNTPEFVGNTGDHMPGYTFNGWRPEVSEKVTKDEDYLAQWIANTGTEYKVEYYKENLEGGYDVWTGIQYGTSDTQGVAQELSFEGFIYNSGDERNVTTGNIDGDGSRVLKLYYNREIYTITWLNEDGTDMDTTSVKYGEVPTHADPTQPADAHYTYKFKGWDPEPTFATGEISYRATYEHIVNKHTITWKNDDGSLIDKTMVEYGTIPTHAKPTKTETEDYRYIFARWDPEVVVVVGDAEYTAVFNTEEKSSKGGGMSGGGGRGGNIDNSDNQHGSAEERSDLFTGDNDTNSGNINDEPLSLYEWVHENDITTMDTLEYADPDGLLTRGHLAKMVVNYMVNVLGRKIPYDVTYNCRYWGDDESSRESDEIRDYATKACAFGVMGINMEDNKFLPNSIVTRAEFGTVMSRVLRGDKYDITDTDNRSYYENHLQALKKDNILTQIANPETRWEIRKWVWLVFRRIVEKYKK